MKCETIRNMMSSYIDKDLNDIDKIELEKHLSECKQCKEEYESLLDIMTVCANLEEIELPQDFRTELHQRLTEEKKRNLFGNILGRKGMKLATGIVAAVLVIVVGIGSLPLLFNINNSKMAQSADSARGYGGTAEFAAEPAAPDVNYTMDMPAADADELILKIKNLVRKYKSAGTDFVEVPLRKLQATTENISTTETYHVTIDIPNIIETLLDGPIKVGAGWKVGTPGLKVGMNSAVKEQAFISVILAADDTTVEQYLVGG